MLNDKECLNLVFFQLPTNALYKKENTKRLKNFPAGYVGNFYRNLTDNIDTSSYFFVLTFQEMIFKNIF